MIAKRLKAGICLLAGLLAGAAAAGFKTGDYHHASIVLKEGAPSKPLSIGKVSGRQVLALSVKNLTKTRDLEFRMDGAEVQSWHPAVVRLPFERGISVNGGRFTGVGSARRIPLYLVMENKAGCGEIEVFDASNGSLIQTVHVMRGGSDGGGH